VGAAGFLTVVLDFGEVLAGELAALGVGEVCAISNGMAALAKRKLRTVIRFT
jgi:hypothetical protein